eukprot:6950638-Karenia_brevis.AAC.1
MEICFRTLKARWNSLNKKRIGQYYGVVIDALDDPLLNLRFADDVLLMATSKTDITKILNDLRLEASTYGLTLHLGKTRVITNAMLKKDKSVFVGGEHVKILGPEESEKYLGRKLCAEEFHATELDNRIRSGWATFA